MFTFAKRERKGKASFQIGPAAAGWSLPMRHVSLREGKSVPCLRPKFSPSVSPAVCLASEGSGQAHTGIVCQGHRPGEDMLFSFRSLQL